MSPNPSTSTCSRCGVVSQHFIHKVPHRGTFHRLCPTCVLTLNSHAFCPICFTLHPHTPPHTTTTTPSCSKCSSIPHSHCVGPTPKTPVDPTPYICPICINPKSPVFQDFKPIDLNAARVLLCAAKIVSGLMSKAVVEARVKAERKAKAAIISRKKAWIATLVFDCVVSEAKRKEKLLDFDKFKCMQCGMGENGDELLLCDKCDRGFHLFCVRPLLGSVSKGSWFCADCSVWNKPESEKKASDDTELIGGQEKSDCNKTTHLTGFGSATSNLLDKAKVFSRDQTDSSVNTGVSWGGAALDDFLEWSSRSVQNSPKAIFDRETSGGSAFNGDGRSSSNASVKGFPFYESGLVGKMKKNNATNSLAAQLKKKTGIHQLKATANKGQTDSGTGTGTGPGSSVQGEGRGESHVANPVENLDRTNVEIIPEDSPPSKRQRVQDKRDDSDSDSHREAGTVSTRTERAGSGKRSSDFRVGKLGLKDLAEMAGSIPDDLDWKAMERISAASMTKKLLAVWGQFGILLAGSAASASNSETQIEELSGKLSEKAKEVADKASKIAELELALATSRDKVSELGVDLKKAANRAKVAETESDDLRKRVGELETELGARKPAEEVIAEFKDSEEYSTALAGAAAAKIYRCWTVAEKHIKTDPESSWEKFTDLYVAAEGAFEESGVEPEPYDGPNLVIPPLPSTVEARTTDQEKTPPGPDGNQTAT